jgi:hypothetical protein
MAAERLDTLLMIQEPKGNVGKMSAKADKNKSRPYRIRTCDTLIKSNVDFFQDFGPFPKLEPTKQLFNF